MPIVIPNNLPATEVLKSENIFVMDESRATTQQIRPLHILLLNLMPKKIETETQIARLIGNTPIQVQLDLLIPTSHHPKNTPMEHLIAFYKTFEEIKDNKYDGMIITGAPVELLDFEQVEYWDELCEIMEWSKHNVYSTFHICWGAQAGLYYHYGIKKFQLPEKLSGVYDHRVLSPLHPLMRGFDDTFKIPHSRYTTVREKDVRRQLGLEILAVSDKAGPSIISSKTGRQLFITGHAEYDRETLANEYYRDVNKGIHPKLPYHYFPDDDASIDPPLVWRSNATLLYTNWLNYFVYQQTPYDLGELLKKYK